jgi:hypothetical protein
MKKLKIYLLGILALSLYACEDDNEGTVDTEAPVFVEVTRPRTQGGSGVVEIRGEYAEIRSEGSTHFHIRGTVTDNVGLSQLRVDVHGVHDGHSHGRMNLLPEFRVDANIDLGGATEFTFDDPDFPNNMLYYDESNGGPFRAGPYDVILHAVDLAGNVTSLANGTSVIRQIYLRRSYQPTIVLAGDPNEEVDELEFKPGEQLALDGWIQQRRGSGNLAFDVTFIRISIVKDDHDHGHRGGEVHYEGIWGTSHFLTSSSGAPLTGRSLPSFVNNQLDFSVIFADSPYTLDEDDDHMILRIEVEDAGGNLAIREFELEVHD